MVQDGLDMDVAGTEPIGVAEAAAHPGWPHAMYPGIYVWYVFVSSLDVMFTWVLLSFGGQEVNVVADYVLQRWDLAGMVVFKFVLVSLVICICEYVGRQRPQLGKCLGEWAVGITCIPVLLATLQMIVDLPEYL